jgi:hypothetical protein
MAVSWRKGSKMADDEITVNSSMEDLPARKYPGMSPLQAGLTYGGGAVATMGPIGLLLGLGAGLFAKRNRDSWMDRESQHRQNLREEHTSLMQELDAEAANADPDERRIIDHAKRLAASGWKRMASGDYATGRKMVEEANQLSHSVMSADSQARKQQEAENLNFQRGLVQTAANDYRTQYLQNMKNFEDLDQKTSEVLNLVNSEDFDPNSKFNKAVVMDLISVGVNGLYRDDPSGLESLVRAVPVIGDALGDAIKQGDYKLTREDYNKIAIELKRSNERYSQQRMQRLGEQATSLDTNARRIGAIPQDYSLQDYVSGKVKDLRLTPDPRLLRTESAKKPPPGMSYPPSEKYVGPLNEKLRGLEQWANKKFPNQRTPRPTN